MSCLRSTLKVLLGAVTLVDSQEQKCRVCSPGAGTCFPDSPWPLQASISFHLEPPLYLWDALHATAMLFYLPWNCSSPAQRGEGCWGMWLSWCPCGVLPGASVGWPTLRSVSSLHTGSISTFNWGAWPLSLWDLRALHSTLFRLGKLGRTRCGSFTGKYV